jgi:hypothetical protein
VLLRTRPVMAVLLVGISAAVACRPATDDGIEPAENVPPLAPVQAQATPSAYQPQAALARTESGSLARTLFGAEGSGIRVEVREILVGPKQRSTAARSAGAAIGEVRSGRGVLNVDGKVQNLQMGSMLSLADGQSYTLENQSDVPLVIRLYVLTAP